MPVCGPRARKPGWVARPMGAVEVPRRGLAAGKRAGPRDQFLEKSQVRELRSALLQLAAMEGEALAAPDDGIAGKTGCPQAQGDEVAQGNQPQ